MDYKRKETINTVCECKPVRVYVTAKETTAASKNPPVQKVIDIIKSVNGIKD